MPVDPNYLAPCGLYCGVCAIMYAARNNDEKFKERLVGVYKGKLPGSADLSAKDIYCEGCLSDVKFRYCEKCEIRDCTKKKGYTGCHQCADFPCGVINDFPVPAGKKVILRGIPHWRLVGTERWVADEEARYMCPSCGNKLFRGAKRCNKCKSEVDLD